MPLPAAIGALAALAGGVLSNAAASSAQERSIIAQRGLQNMLLNSGATMARNAKQAGLSPAFALGSSSTPVAPAASSNSAPFDFSGVQSLLGNMSLRKLQKQQEKVSAAQEKEVLANADIAQEKANQEELHTKVLRNKLRAFEPTDMGMFLNPETHQPMSEDEANAWMQTHTDMPEWLPSSNKEITGAYGEFLANRERSEYGMYLSDSETRMLKNLFDRKVYDKQIKDDDVISAVADMPKYQQKSVITNIRHVLSEIQQNKFENALLSSQRFLADVQSYATGIEADIKDVEKGSKEWHLLNEKLRNTNELLRDVKKYGFSKQSAKRVLQYISAKGDDLIDKFGGAASNVAGARAGHRMIAP